MCECGKPDCICHICKCGIKDCIGHPKGDTTLPARTAGEKHTPVSLSCCLDTVNCAPSCCDTNRKVYIIKRNKALDGDISAMFEE